MKYYHGGPKGLRVGQKILSPAVTGALSTASFGAAGICDRNKVYITSSPVAALMYASMLPNGAVYQVRPVGEISDDPDCNEPGLSFECAEAIIVGVVRIKGKALKRARKAVLA